jgi:hypothetical protein
MRINFRDILDFTALRRQIDAGFISERKHPTADLFIYNYTPVAAWAREWTREQRVCRGLIVDGAGYVQARPFEKFFNIGELPETELAVLPTDDAMFACEKCDGSLGVVFWNDGRPEVATRGSFTSPMAIWATEWINTPGNIDLDHLREWDTYTLLVEIISPVSRIVIDYKGDYGLRLLAARGINTGHELYPTSIKTLAEMLGLRPASVKHIKSLDELFSQVETATGIEGWVVTFPNASGGMLRVKIKTKEYYDLHRLITGISVKLIREHVIAGTLDGYIDKMPVYLQREARRIRDELIRRRDEISTAAAIAYAHIITAGPDDRPSFARRVQAVKHPLASLLFTLYGAAHGQVYKNGAQATFEAIVWKLVNSDDIAIVGDILEDDEG